MPGPALQHWESIDAQALDSLRVDPRNPPGDHGESFNPPPGRGNAI